MSDYADDVLYHDTVRNYAACLALVRNDVMLSAHGIKPNGSDPSDCFVTQLVVDEYERRALTDNPSDLTGDQLLNSSYIAAATLFGGDVHHWSDMWGAAVRAVWTPAGKLVVEPDTTDDYPGRSRAFVAAWTARVTEATANLSLTTEQVTI